MKKNFKLSILLVLTLSMLMASPTVSQIIRPTIIIGAIGPLDITPGNDMQKGVRLAVEEINGGAGVMVGLEAHDFELVIGTTSGANGLPDAPTAAVNTQDMIVNDGVVALIGGFRTEVVLGAIEPTINATGTPFLGVGSTAPITTEYYYRVGPVNGTTLARNLIGFYLITMAARGVSNVVIVREDAAWTEAVGGAVASTLAIGGLLGSINFTVGADVVINTAATGSDINSAMNYLVGSDVDALITLFAAPVGKEVTIQWDALGLSDEMYLAGINVEAQKGGHFLATGGSAEGEIDFEAAPPGTNPTTKTAAFREAYQVRWGELPTYTSFASYDSVYILKEAIERADAFTSAAIQAELPNTDYLGTSARIKFTSESSAGQVASSSVPEAFKKYNNTVAHDLFTTSTVGVSGLPYSSPYFAQWQSNGLKKAVWQTTTEGFDAINGPPYIPVTVTSSVTESVTSTDTVTDTDTVTTDEGVVGSNLYFLLFSTMLIATYISRTIRRKR